MAVRALSKWLSRRGAHSFKIFERAAGRGGLGVGSNDPPKYSFVVAGYFMGDAVNDHLQIEELANDRINIITVVDEDDDEEAFVVDEVAPMPVGHEGESIRRSDNNNNWHISKRYLFAVFMPTFLLAVGIVALLFCTL